MGEKGRRGGHGGRGKGKEGGAGGVSRGPQENLSNLALTGRASDLWKNHAPSTAKGSVFQDLRKVWVTSFDSRLWVSKTEANSSSNGSIIPDKKI